MIHNTGFGNPYFKISCIYKNMNNFFLASYLFSICGLVLSLIYNIHDVLQCRRLQNLVPVRQVQPSIDRRPPVARKYVSRYRSKMFQRRLINEINRINGELRIKPPKERYELYYDGDGEIQVRCGTSKRDAKKT